MRHHAGRRKWLPSGLRCGLGQVRASYEYSLGRRKADSPKLLRALIQIDEFNAVGAETFDRTDLGDNSGRDFGAELIAQDDGGADGQLAIQLNRRAMFIEVRRLGGDLKSGFVSVVARQGHGCV